MPLPEGEYPWKGLRISVQSRVSQMKHANFDGGLIIDRSAFLKALAERWGDGVASEYGKLIHTTSVGVSSSSFRIVPE